MIEIDVAEYCHECPAFEAETTKCYADNKLAKTIVSCVHWRKCREIYKSVKERLEKKESIKVYRDENGDVFCSSCGFPLHRQRSEGNYCSGCGAALDWN